jgi:hypothetical protein
MPRIGFIWLRIAYDSERDLVSCDQTNKPSEWFVTNRLRFVRSKSYTDSIDTVVWNNKLGRMLKTTGNAV